MAILILGFSSVTVGVDKYNDLLDRFNVTNEVLKDSYASAFIGIPGKWLIYNR